jgi:2-dehydro-3-deoxyglucarate aldolase
VSRHSRIVEIRRTLAAGEASIGSWMQIPHSAVAEVMGQAGYDWVAVDLEHGSIDVHQLPDLFRALEAGGTLPLVRVAEGTVKDCQQALDAGAGGVIVPRIETAAQLSRVVAACAWPPAGERGVGFSRANLFGKHFAEYSEEAQAPLVIAMIEHVRALDDLDAIAATPGLDAILIGPYDLSASMGLTARFDRPEFAAAIDQIRDVCRRHRVASGVHVVQPDPGMLAQRIREGHRFIAYSIDSVFLVSSSARPT